jgi:hypothetical protein
MLRLLAFDGLAGTGKDAIADGLVRSHGFVKVPFAKVMKEIFSKVFNIPVYYFDVRALKDAPLKDPISLTSGHIVQLAEEFIARGIEINTVQIAAAGICLGRILISPRDIMQFVGTDVVRVHMDNMMWIKLWDIEQRKYERVIAPDARFPDEREFVRNMKGKVLLVKREGIEAQAHTSENSKWPEDKYDAIINNNVSLGQIQSEVSMWYTLIK